MMSGSDGPAKICFNAGMMPLRSIGIPAMVTTLPADQAVLICVASWS